MPRRHKGKIARKGPQDEAGWLDQLVKLSGGRSKVLLEETELAEGEAGDVPDEVLEEQQADLDELEWPDGATGDETADLDALADQVQQAIDRGDSQAADQLLQELDELLGQTKNQVADRQHPPTPTDQVEDHAVEPDVIESEKVVDEGDREKEKVPKKEKESEQKKVPEEEPQELAEWEQDGFLEKMTAEFAAHKKEEIQSKLSELREQLEWVTAELKKLEVAKAKVDKSLATVMKRVAQGDLGTPVGPELAANAVKGQIMLAMATTKSAHGPSNSNSYISEATSNELGSWWQGTGALAGFGNLYGRNSARTVHRFADRGHRNDAHNAQHLPVTEFHVGEGSSLDYFNFHVPTLTDHEDGECKRRRDLEQDVARLTNLIATQTAEKNRLESEIEKLKS
jgi:prefoldin subunit 5